MGYECTEKLLVKMYGGLHGIREELEEREKSFIDTGLKSLKGSKVVYTRTTEIDRCIRYIEKTLHELNVSDDAARETSITDSFYSATIEGANTTIKKVIETRLEDCSKNERMVINTKKALDMAMENGVTDENIRSIWENVVDGVCENIKAIGVKYRDKMVYIGSNIKIIHIPANQDELEWRMKSLFDYIERCEHSPIDSSIIHFYFAYIHPFCDGNGRTVRILEHQLLSKWLEGFNCVAISEAIYNNLSRYYKALYESETDYNGFLDITPFIEFMLNVIIAGMETNIIRHSALNENHMMMLKLAGNRAGVTTKEAAAITGLSDCSCRKCLKELLNMGRVDVHSEKGTHVYTANSIASYNK